MRFHNISKLRNTFVQFSLVMIRRLFHTIDILDTIAINNINILPNWINTAIHLMQNSETLIDTKYTSFHHFLLKKALPFMISMNPKFKENIYIDTVVEIQNLWKLVII